jgi:FkbM family methyltransferase
MGPRSLKVRIGRAEFEVTSGRNDAFWAQVNAGTWEPETFAVFDQNVREDTIAVDVGAWIGPTTLYLASIAKRVFAFEPDPVAYEELLANLSLNPHLTNVTVSNTAVTAQGGSVHLGVRSHAGDSSSSLLIEAKDGWTVPSVSFLEVLQTIEATPFVKIDVEGYEFFFGRELARGLRKQKGRALLALHPHFFGVARAARIGRTSKLRKTIGSVVKRTIGRYEGFSAVRELASYLERDEIEVTDLDGTPLDLKTRSLRALVGMNVTSSGSVLLRLSETAR